MSIKELPQNASSTVFRNVSVLNMGQFAYLNIDIQHPRTKVLQIGSTQRVLTVFTSMNYPKYLFMQSVDRKPEGPAIYSLDYRMMPTSVANTNDPQELFNAGLTTYIP